MSYKVLNMDNERIIVEQINPTIHKHLSGRDFSEQMLEWKKISKWVTLTQDNVVEVIDEAIKSLEGVDVEYKWKTFKIEWINEEEDKETIEAAKKIIDLKTNFTREQAIQAYKEKYGRRPSSKMKTENIIAKL